MTNQATDNALHEIADAVLAIEQTMRAGDFWHDSVPSPAAMASRTPFCADTLEFSEWLQFVFLPRMRALIENNQPLPSASAIAPLAEEALRDHAGRDVLLDRLRQFDQLIAARN